MSCMCAYAIPMQTAEELADDLLREEEQGLQAAQRARQQKAVTKARQKQRKQVRLDPPNAHRPAQLCGMAIGDPSSSTPMRPRQI